MSHFKSPDDKLHFLDDDSFEHLLPEGSVKITDEEAALIAEVNKPVPDLKALAQAYLNSTDWYVTRFVETQVAIPKDVLEKRAEARLAI